MSDPIVNKHDRDPARPVRPAEIHGTAAYCMVCAPGAERAERQCTEAYITDPMAPMRFFLVWDDYTNRYNIMQDGTKVRTQLADNLVSIRRALLDIHEKTGGVEFSGGKRCREKRQ